MTLAIIALLAQLSHPCNPLSVDNPTLYVRRDNGSISCFDWNQAVCGYVERPCHADELLTLCNAFPNACDPEPIILLPILLPPRCPFGCAAIVPMRPIARSNAVAELEG